MARKQHGDKGRGERNSKHLEIKKEKPQNPSQHKISKGIFKKATGNPREKMRYAWYIKRVVV